MDGRRVGIVALPKIFVQHEIAPRDVVALGQLPKTAAIHVPGRREPGRLKQRRPNIDVGDDFLDHRTTIDHLRAVHQERHAHRRLVGGSLVDQALFAKLKSVVAHVHEQRGLQQILLLKQIKQAAEIFVDSQQCLAVTDVIGVQIEIRQVVGEVHAVPTVALVPQPAWLVAKVFAALRKRLRYR